MSADGQILFEIKNLCKSFGETEVLKNISTTISQGEVVFSPGFPEISRLLPWAHGLSWLV